MIDTWYEQWKPIGGYEGLYEVSTLGRVSTVERVVIGRNGRRKPLPQTFLTPRIGRTGRVTVTLIKAGTATRREVASLVLEAFVDSDTDARIAMPHNAIAGDVRLENLGWVERNSGRDDLPGENWLPVVGYEGRYEISDQGRVWSVPRTTVNSDGRTNTVPGGILRPMANAFGHMRCSLVGQDGKVKSAKVHRLVLEAFVGPCPAGQEACHYNDVPDDNRLENLRWDTPSANKYDCVRNGHHKEARKTHCKNGHAFTPENTKIGKQHRSGRPRRDCRECHRASARRAKARRESAA